MRQLFHLRAVIVGSFIATSALLCGPQVAPGGAVAQTAEREAPFGDRVGPAVTNDNRLRPQIATAGVLKEGAIDELKALGFITILDLRRQDEGIDLERRAVDAAGLRYLNIPFTGPIPSDAQVAEFAGVVEIPGISPL